MSVDLKQFHQAFIEESLEGLDIMEDALMALDAENIDSENINAIFRAAHSIKGGSSTFGFSAIASFTHVLETLLDQIRAGRRGVSHEDINLFLRSVDAMREMLLLLQQEQNVLTDSALQLKIQFDQLLSQQNVNPPEPIALKETMVNVSSDKRWHITFIPQSQILRSGNCPLRILRELANLGELNVCAESGIPLNWSSFDPENCYLRWHLDLTSDCDETVILDLFEWVRDEAELHIECLPVGNRRLRFEPYPDLLRSGNEPVRIFNNLLDAVSSCQIIADPVAIPPLQSLDPEKVFLRWTLLISDNIRDEDVLTIFDWVKDDALVQFDDDLANPSAEVATEIPADFHAETRLTETESASLLIAEPAATHLPKNIDTESPKKSVNPEASSIRVGIDKIDSLINMVGELVITQSMLSQLSNELDAGRVPKLLEGLNQLAQNTRELQESVMRIRMLPISFTFSRFPRMVRDLGLQLGKKIQLELSGEHTELDKTVMEKIGDPLVHLVRNAVDHGIETPQERLAAGKPEEGRIVLNAYHQSGNVIIEIIDDGRGLDRSRILAKALENNLISAADAQSFSDEQIYDLIFQPGFSTAQTVSDVSGRGVGMDVVKRNIQALNGVVEIQSKPGLGSKILVRLPLTLAILDGQLVRVNHHIYIFPLVAIVESMQYKIDNVRNIAGGCSVFKLREDYVPIVQLKEIFNIASHEHHSDQPLMVVVEADGEKVGIVVDELLAQQQVVIKSLEQNYRKVEGVSGATILGDGTVALILDIEGLVKIAGLQQLQQLVMSDAQQQAAHPVSHDLRGKNFLRH